MTVEYLKKNNDSCDANLAQYYVMDKIREDSGIKDGNFKFEVIENKKMLNTIYKVYLLLKKDDLFYLSWGELNLNKW